MRRVAWLALFLCTLSAGGFSQNRAGTIHGTVTDPDGAVVPGVEITVTNTDTNRERIAFTNDSGNYSITSLPVGPYRIRASRNDFQTFTIEDITLHVDDLRRENITLQIGSPTEVVNVIAETSLLQSDESSIGTVIDRQKIAELPLNGRRSGDLLQLAPGVVTPAQGSELASRGGSNVGGMDENTTSYFLDGLDNGDPVLRSRSFQAPVDLIQEFKVEESAYAAEFGRNAGAVVNVTTRSGTNELHGSVWEFIRNDNLDARNYFATSEFPKPDLIRNQFGIALGGPIARDRTFVFVLYEGIREKRGETRRATVPTLAMRNGDFSELLDPTRPGPPDVLGRQFPTGTLFDPRTTRFVNGSFVRDPYFDAFGVPSNIIPSSEWHPITRNAILAYPVPNFTDPDPLANPLVGNRIEIANHIEDVDDVSLRFDHQLLENTQVMFRYSFSNARVEDPFRTEAARTDILLKDFGQTSDRIRTNTGIGFTSILGPSMVHEFRMGYNRFKQPLSPVRDIPPEQIPVSGFVQSFLGFSPGGNASPIGSGSDFFRVVNVYNYVDQLTWVRGNHIWKFGIDVRRYLFNAFSATPNQFFFVGARTAQIIPLPPGPGVPPGLPEPGGGNGVADMLLGFPVATINSDGNPYGNTRKTELAGYFQDDWKASGTLTLNYGLRWEWYGRVLENIDKQSNWDPACGCIVVAGVDASRQMVEDDLNNFAPRFGLAYRPLDSQRTVIRGGFGIFYDNEQRHNFSQFANPPFFETEIFEAANPYFPDLTMDNPFPAGAAGPLAPRAIPIDYRDTYAEHWNISLQHEIVSGIVLDIAYVGNHVVKMQRTRNVNQPIQPIPGLPRPNTGFGPILLFEQAGNSNYHSLQARLEQRFRNGLTFISSYTWGHAIDDRPAEGNASFRGFQNAYDAKSERGDSDFDVRHRYSLSWIYELPGTGLEGLAGDILDGWAVNGIMIAQSGRPFSIWLPASSLRPDVVPGVDPVPSDQGPDNWINPAAFTTPAFGEFGTLGRNTLRGPGLFNLDFSVSRKFPLNDARSLQFRAEFFNLTNHPNFGLPDPNFSGQPTSTFGIIGSTVTPARQIQFGLRYDF